MTISAGDFGASARFYETSLAAVGVRPDRRDEALVQWRELSLVEASAEAPPTRRLHVAFAVASREAVDAFWHAGRAIGAPDAGAPGPRPRYTPSYYGAFLLDPAGNSAEAVHRDGQREDGLVDHVWIRVADLAAARRHYEACGLRVAAAATDRVRFVREGGGGGTFSIVRGPPTEHLHVAFEREG